MLKIGSHVGMSGKEMFLGSAKEAASYGANTFMIYTGAPQNTRRKKIEELNLEAGFAYMKEHGLSDIIIHAPYIINLGNTVKEETFSLATQFLAMELERTEAIGSKYMVLHPGAHVGAGTEAGIKQIVKGINDVLTKDTNVYIALETMAGKGSEVGKTFEELAMIYDGVIDKFDKCIGKDQIAVFHINDSKNELGAAKDRHENIGFGKIGFDALSYIVHHKDFENVPKILETPYVSLPDNKDKSFAPYKYEINMLREQQFDDKLLENVVNQL